MSRVNKPPTRIYADTSVFGGVFDPEFAEASARFFARVRAGFFQLIVSAIVADELVEAPARVRSLFNEMLPLAELIPVSAEAVELQESYLQANIVTRKWAEDALHVALAAVSGCDLIVSWNFDHIVHFQKIPRYNAVNVLHGYRPIAIYSPLEVVSDESESI
jgi:predicted nucleic acid-binding protein